MLIYLLLSILVIGSFFVLSLKKPRIALMVLLALVGLWPSYVAIILPGVGFALTPQRVGFLLLFSAWLIHVAYDKTMRVRVSETIESNKSVFYLAIAYFIFGIVGSAIVSAAPVKSVAAGVFQFISYPLVLVFVITYFSQRKHLILLFYVLMMIALITEIIGLAEWVHQDNIFAIFVDPVSEVAQVMMTAKVRGDVYRIQSTFSNPLAFAEFLLLMMPVSLYFLYPRKCGVAIRLLAGVQIILGLICIYLTASRTSILLAVLFTIIFGMFLSRLERMNWSKVIFGSIVMVLLGAIFLPWDTIAAYVVGDSETVNSTLGRIYQLEAGIPAALKSPFFGYVLAQGVIYVAPLKSIDNYYLTAALDTGLTGLVILLWFQWRSFKSALNVNSANMFPKIGTFLAMAFLGLFINELTLSIIEPFTFFFAILGVIMIMKYNGNQNNQPRKLSIKNV